jgi:hypothetical protein
MPWSLRSSAKRLPIALLLALAGSLALHGVFLLAPDLGPTAEEMEPLLLTAELRPPPQNPAVNVQPPAKKSPPPAKAPPVLPGVASDPAPAPVADTGNATTKPAGDPAASQTASSAPVQALQPGSGRLRYAMLSSRINVWIGVAEYRWEFTDDGRYRLYGVTETTGIVSLFKPMRLETESVGRLVAGGLQPEHYRTVKNGNATRENAEFDWSAGELHLERDGSVLPLTPGTQDLLSLNFQIAYLEHPENGARLGVVTGKKYETYPLESLGEENLQTDAGLFRTLHLKVAGKDTTEIWVALDRYKLPVKIRFTDRKGDIYEQVVTSLE